MTSTIRWATMWKVGFFNSLIVAGLACFLISGAHCKRSACWRYGHVCWGGHGKRSGQPPLAPISGSVENVMDDSAMPGLYAAQPLQWKYPEVNHVPKTRFHEVTNSNGAFSGKMQQLSPTLLMMQPHNPVEQYKPHQFQLNPYSMMLKHNGQRHRQPIPTRPRYTTITSSAGGLIHDLDGNVFDSSVIIPNDEMAEENTSPYASAFKRSALDFQGNGGTRGTEEPLVTSANGQDDPSGSFATFFRDRKSFENSGQERYLATSTSQTGQQAHASEPARQRLQLNNMFGILPFTQNNIEREGMLAKARMSY